MSVFDSVVAGLFSLLVLAVGFSFSRSGASLSSFFAAGGNVPWWISGLSLFMSFFSVGTFVVWGAIAYTWGLVAVVIQLTMCIAGFLVGYFIAPKWRETGSLTAAEFVRQRLGERAQKIYTTIFLFITVFGAGAFLYPVGKIIEVTTGIPLMACILLLGIFIIAYTAAGGLWAVLVSDVLQFVVLSAAVLVVVFLALGEIGGMSSFVKAAPTGFFDLHNEQYGILFITAFGFYNLVLIGGNWAYVQRYTSVSTPRDAKKVAWLFGALYLIAPIIWMLPPMIYRVINPDLSALESEGAYLMVSQAVVPNGLMGLILGAMVFASASSVNTTLNISAGVFTNDIYRILRPGASQRETMTVAKLATILFGVVAILVALSVKDMGGIVEVVMSLAAITGAPLYLAPIWALFSRVQTGSSIVFSTVASLAINAFFKFLSEPLLGIDLSRSVEMLVGISSTVILLGTFEIYFRVAGREPKEYENYLLLRDAQRQKDTEASPEQGGIGNLYGRKVLSFGVLCIGLMVVGLGLLSDKAILLIACIGAVIVLLSLLMFPWRARGTLSRQSGLRIPV